ncbi:MAG: hypothetical protein ACE5JX_17500 [Acidobacteriota bacterium]
MATDETKITVQVPRELLRQARALTGDGITATVRRGLQLLAAREAYRRLRQLKGKVRFSIPVDSLREDR